MTQPGAPQQHPHGQPYPQQHQQFPPQQQQYPPQYQQGVPWAQPPKKRRGKGVLIGVLVVVLLAGLAGGGLWLWEELDDPAPPPPVDASKDLEKAPIGCAMFDEAEVKPYIPGKMDYEAGGANSGSGDSYDQGQCGWNNTGSLGDGVRGAFVIVTSYVYHANQELSGVDRAKEHLEQRVRTGVAVNVTDAEDALLVANRKADWSVQLVVRYRNVVYAIDYSNQNEGVNVKGGATALATIAISKVVPDEDEEK
jgi:hypothetical protein